MTLWENNLSPYATFVEGSTPASPSAGQQRTFIDSADHKFKRVNSSGTVTIIEGGGGGGTDPLTTKGDVWCWSTTDARLAVGSNGQVITAASGQTTGLQYQYPPGYQFDRASISTAASITATAWGSATTVITGNSVTYDGSTEVIIEFFSPTVVESVSNVGVFIGFFDGATQLGAGGAQQTNSTSGEMPFYLRRFWTPSAAAHTITVKGIVGSGTGTVQAGDGTGSNFVNAYLRITKA